MKFKQTGLAFFFILALFLSACGGGGTPTATPKKGAASETPNGSSAWRPTDVAEDVIKGEPVDLSLGSSIEILTPTPTPAGTVEPVYGSVIIKDASVSLPDGSSTPVVRVQGYLPSPCHKLIVKMDPNIQQNMLGIHILSSALLQVKCNSKYQPFDQTIRLVDIPKGKYTIWVNGNNISTVTIQ